MKAGRVFRILIRLLAGYAIGWSIAFVCIVGFEPSLAADYFLSGWSFSGQELTAWVWWIAWVIFIGLVLVAAIASRYRRSTPPR
ncbi:hypothetical protein ACQQ2N_06030 [Dokdonella sp. MW10]|uniref:hypothetical protein n=1 Tax=Dokdonella sp. MW10 TaxID=2992926 RepID=UPI003F823A41